MTESSSGPGGAQQHKYDPINVYDTNAVKRLLDEVATQVIIDKGYDENHFVSNVKITLGLITCSFALLAQFYPKKFPSNFNLLVICIVGYILCNCALQLFCYIREKDHILITHPNKERSFTSFGLAVSSMLPRFSDTYTLTIADTRPASVATAREPVSLCKSYTTWFDSTGLLAEKVFVAEVQKLLADYENSDRKKSR
eukprot:jgi/Chlat1/5190/Chrsp33S05162